MKVQINENIALYNKYILLLFDRNVCTVLYTAYKIYTIAYLKLLFIRYCTILLHSFETAHKI